ncbi:cytochrome c oxidase subunit 3 [Coralliovum pocilloporae]|uniref:cytochrome c oxidase subunit 3 n=1 Tax=Coralliovum pocilloporae TaxID=3066369 RepID=UPI003306E4A9
MSEEVTGPRTPDDDWSPDRLPGDLMMWILIASELAVFGIGLIAFVIAGSLNPDLFARGRAGLDSALAAINTMVLLTSGYFAACALEAVRSDNHRKTCLHLGLAGTLGIGFVVLKWMEYSAKWQAGYGLESDVFQTLYFMITGFHAAHVVFGLAILGYAAVYRDRDTVQTATVFWHMVDLIWLLIFPVIYLMGAA